MHQESTPNSLLHGSMHNQQASNPQAGIGASIQNHPTNQPLTWSCELCGRMFATRDEWSLHAKSHLEVCYCWKISHFCLLHRCPNWCTFHVFPFLNFSSIDMRVKVAV